MSTLIPKPNISERAEALEMRMITELNDKMLDRQAEAQQASMVTEFDHHIATKSVLYNLADGVRNSEGGRKLLARYPGKTFLMDQDPRLPRLPAAPTLLDFFSCRFMSLQHLLQSAAHALRAGLPEKQVVACLLHDISVSGFIRADHGYWGSALIAPYVDEEIAWAIKVHQALRFDPDPSVGYQYPEMYAKYFGEEYEPEDYIKAEIKAARNHKWYMTARMITVYDVYSFDASSVVLIDDFVDLLGRHFKQPKEGLGFDGSPAAHMWRTMIWPNKFL